MNLFQIVAYFPGLGKINLISSPSLQEAKKVLDGTPKNANDLTTVTVGGAILLPYANRIRGKLSADRQTIEAEINGYSVTLPANWQGKDPGAERDSIHGLMLNAKFSDVTVRNGRNKSQVTGRLHAGNFGGRWISALMWWCKQH